MEAWTASATVVPHHGAGKTLQYYSTDLDFHLRYCYGEMLETKHGILAARE